MANNGATNTRSVSSTENLNGLAAKLPDIAADAQRVLDVLIRGGLAIIPSDVGYGIVAIESIALERAFKTKQRKPHKRHAMIGSFALHQELHTLSDRETKMVELLCKDLDLPLGVIAPFRKEHPILQKLGSETLSKSTMDGSLAMLVNGGRFQDKLSELASLAGLPLMGSSANLTGKGTKSSVEDIEPEIMEAADIVIDYGKRKYSVPRPSSTMIDFRSVELVRFGACYDVIKDVLHRFYGIQFPDDPGRDRLFSGHLNEAALQY